jgi:hypothetical protein
LNIALAFAPASFNVNGFNGAFRKGSARARLWRERQQSIFFFTSHDNGLSSLTSGCFESTFVSQSLLQN